MLIAIAGRPSRDVQCRLTDREIEVLRLVARGYSNQPIANALTISAHTAQHHVIHTYANIGVSSRAAAALLAVEHDLLSIAAT